MIEQDLNSLKLENQLCFPIYVLVRDIVNEYRPLLNELDLTYPQYLVLLVLWETDDMTVNQIGEKLFLDSGTLTPLLKRLEQKEIVTRVRSKKDERVVKIKLTKHGKDLQAKACEVPSKLAEKMNVSMEDLMDLRRIITKIKLK